MDTRGVLLAILSGGIRVVFLRRWWKYRRLTPRQRKRAMPIGNPRLATFVRHPTLGLFMGVLTLVVALAALLLPWR